MGFIGDINKGNGLEHVTGEPLASMREKARTRVWVRGQRWLEGKGKRSRSPGIRTDGYVKRKAFMRTSRT
jgi:hypothetical protein